MQFNHDLVEEIRSKCDIVDIIGKYVHLEKKGNSYMGLCPFHNEKSPSFSVSKTKQIYHCFGCGKGGDVFTFIQEYNNMTFPEALEDLAKECGVELPEVTDNPGAVEQRNKRQLLLNINKEAAKYYYKQLRSERGKAGLEYFRDRKLSDATMQRFGLGYSGISGKEIVTYLKAKGYKDSDIIEAGLASFDEKFGTHDKFWNRVMFPIMDASQHVIGFGGRVMGDGKPKYLNSPETPVFDKSRNLYGLNYAKNANKGHLILCEGYMDVIAMHQAGFTEAVASLGTAFTSGQAQILKRYTNEIILSYDSDGAGVKAALRGIEILKEVGLRGKVLNLEPYKDPDEFIKNEGSEVFAQRIKEAENTFFFEIRMLQRQFDMSDPASKTQFQREIAKMLCQFEENLERENYTQAVAARFNIPVKDLKALVVSVAATGIPRKNLEKPKNSYVKKTDPADTILKSQRVLLTWLADEPTLYTVVKKYIKVSDFTDDLYRKVAEKMFEGLDEGSFLPATVVSLFSETKDQAKVAEIFNTNLIRIETKDEKEKAMHDIIMNIRTTSYEKQMKELQLDNADAITLTIEGKKELEKLAHTRISLD
ncbi:DNA primase [Butyrivibrio sp. NC3005]|uniref:DNA primase n=1 Tax=Butyrivibrio sp. NC3005 TaxID=1280685 RepID=UPI000415FADB|nr:DNA primase [Butyrivibrio sp. NC3005]